MNTYFNNRYGAFIGGLLFSSLPVFAQVPTPSSNKNYVMEHTVRVPDITDKSQLAGKNVSQVNRSIQYVDGLGRSEQTIVFSGSPSGNDIVQHIAYDEFGREQYIYLPYVAGAGDGTFKTTAAADQIAFYGAVNSALIASDAAPFSRIIFETSPLNRVLKQGAPGADWQPDEVISNSDNAVIFEYLTNVAGEVFEWEITELGSCKLSSNTHFSENQLYVTVTKDENWISGNDGTVREYKDKQGRVVLKRTFDENIAHDTYYVYDDFGNLRVVLPPEAIKKLGSALANIPDQNVYTKDGTLSGTKSEAYYYCPGVTVRILPGFIGKTNFEIKPYPVDADLVDQYLFTYKYDKRQRMIEKKVPGADPVYIVYDQRDRLVLTQDGNQRASKQWTFTKYDQLNRPVLTGNKIIVGSRSTVQDAVNIFYEDDKNPMFEDRSGDWTGSDHGYTDLSYPKGIGTYDYLSVRYYDNYGFIASADKDSFDFNNTNGVNNGPELTSPKGQATGGKVKVLDDNEFLKSTTFYDHKYRVIQSRGDHYNGDTQDSYMAYDFVGQVTKSKLVYHDGDETIEMTERFEYDHAGRLMKAWHQMNELLEVLSSENTYNELGELIDKKLHYNEESNDYVQSVDYRYNIRGWLTSINNASRTHQNGVNEDSNPNDLFGMNLVYNDDRLGIGATKMYNGNISAMAWSNASYSGRQKAYNFGYDKLNRLNTADYKEKTSLYWNANLNHFNVNGIKYDQNGNIQWLNRYESNTMIDELDYEYDGNRLLWVNDRKNHASGFKDGEESTLEYLYDANGNMITDKNKEIKTIEYNMLNLPEKITFENYNYILYSYDAAGTKLGKKVYESGKAVKETKYIGGMIFEDNSLKIIQTAEGRIAVEKVANDNTYDYQYYLKDHLGNNRVVFKSDEVVYKATIEDEYSVTEEAEFKNVDRSRYTGYNITEKDASVSSPDRSAMLNSHHSYSDGTRRIIGPAKGLKVYPGDVIDMEVWARYKQVNTSKTSVAKFLFTALTASFGVTAGENLQVYSAFNSLIGGTALINQNSGETPKAFLNYIFFDNNYKNPDFGFAQVSSSAASSHQKLTLSKTIESEGYIYIYVSNESTLNVNVYYDDLKITHSSPSMVVQANDYYPFGLTMKPSLFKREGEMENDFLYNGKELQTDLDLDWYDYGARFYSPTLARFTTIDPLSDNYYGLSTYSYCAGNPIKNIDVNGEFIGTIIGTVVGAAAGAYNAYKTPGADVWAGAAEGAVAGAITGAAIDLAVAATVATGGGALVVIGAGVAAGAIGGGAGAVLGDATGNAVSSYRKSGGSLSTGLSDFSSSENVSEKIVNGTVSGAVGGVAGGAVGKAISVVKSSTNALQSTMTRNITQVSKALPLADDATILGVQKAIEGGIEVAGASTRAATTTAAITTSTITDTVIKAIEEEH